MELKFKTALSTNGKPRHLIFYNDEWLSFFSLAATSKAITNDLSPQILQWRWAKGRRTESELFAKKDSRGRNKIDVGLAQEGGLFNGCSGELSNACMNGTNNDLLRINASREPYITKGEKRRQLNQL